jgi:hypothetical protein
VTIIKTTLNSKAGEFYVARLFCELFYMTIKISQEDTEQVSSL